MLFKIVHYKMTKKIAKVFGEKGIAVEDHIVVYDDDAWKAAFLLSVLDYCGAKNISFLKGGIDFSFRVLYKY